MHRLYGLVVQQEHLAVAEYVSVAAVKRGLYLRRRDFSPLRVERVADVEGSARCVAYRDER